MSSIASTVQNLHICRLCLKLTSTKMDIFTEDFPKMIEILTTLKVKENDNLPKFSCLKCARDVKAAILTRRRIIQSYRALISKKEGFSNASENDEDSVVSSDDAETQKKPAEVVIKTEKDKTDCTKPSEILKQLKPLIKAAVDNPQKTNSTEAIQKLRLDTNAMFLHKLKVLEAKQKVSGMKFVNRKDQINLAKWLVKKKNVDYKKLPSKPRNQETKPLYCTFCKLKFNNKVTYRNHMTTHKNKKCPACNKIVRASYFHKHQILHTSMPVICEECGITCKNASSLRMHKVYYHRNSQLSVCEDCGRSFRTKTKLRYHQRKDHTKERNFKCETCGKAFFLKMYLTKHINMKHMKLRPHICEYCGKGFSGKHALRTHVRQHTNEAPFICNLCGERFRQKVSLRGHLKSKHDIKEESKFFCETCGKGYATSTALDVHSRLHNEMKCPHCSDTFGEQLYLDQHISNVHGNLQEVVDENGLKWMNL